jgi:hypothetical protein
MTLPNTIKVLLLITYLFLLQLPFSQKIEAASIFLNPATGTVSTSEFNIGVTVDSESDTTVLGTKAFISYDPSVFEVLKIENGNFSNYILKNTDPAAGLITIDANLNTPIDSNTIVTLATIAFKTKTNNTSTQISFLKTTPYQTKVTNSDQINLLTNYIDANLTINTNQNDTVTKTSSTVQVPTTGSTNFLAYTLTISLLIILSFTIRKYAISKL